jgi:hypothetical protein
VLFPCLLTLFYSCIFSLSHALSHTSSRPLSQEHHLPQTTQGHPGAAWPSGRRIHHPAPNPRAPDTLALRPQRVKWSRRDHTHHPLPAPATIHLLSRLGQRDAARVRAVLHREGEEVRESRTPAHGEPVAHVALRFHAIQPCHAGVHFPGRKVISACRKCLLNWVCDFITNSIKNDTVTY